MSGERGEEFLQTDNAITGYCWALWSMGVDISGFLYHEQKKSYPQPPTMNTRPYRGCWFSQNKQQGTTYEMYLQTVKEQDAGAFAQGLYNEMLSYLKAAEQEAQSGGAEGDLFHKRYQVHRSATELANAGLYIAMEAMDMTDQNLRIYPQPGRFSCGGCAYRTPCIGQTAGEDYIYTLSSMYEKRDHYWVREEPSTDAGMGMS
jgi:hypothetical protein